MLSIFIGYILELTFGKPKWLPQPIDGLNFLISNLRRRRWTDALLTLSVIGASFAAVKFLTWKLPLDFILIYFALSLKSCPPDDIEYIANNTAKAVLGVLFYAFLGGAALAWIYKAVNALDESDCYMNPGRLSRWLAVVFNYIPSRMCIIIVPFAAYMCRMGFKRSFKVACEEGSPQDAIPAAAFAGALGVQLGGLSYGKGIPVHKPYLGQPYNELNQAQAEKAVKLMYASSVILMSVMIIVNYFWNVL